MVTNGDQGAGLGWPPDDTVHCRPVGEIVILTRRSNMSAKINDGAGGGGGGADVVKREAGGYRAAKPASLKQVSWLSLRACVWLCAYRGVGIIICQNLQ